MSKINRKLILDSANCPVAVQVDYADWLEIERRLDLADPPAATVDLNRFAGKIHFAVDPLTYQKQLRREWPE